MSLTPKEIQQFHQSGYLIRSDVFNQTDLEPIKTAITEMIDRQARQLKVEGQLADICATEPFERRLARICEINPAACQAILGSIMGKGGGGYSGPAMLQMLRHPPLISCIESLVGPDIIGSSVYRIRPKLPGWDRGEVPWHQDSGYLLAHCDQYLIVTCWIPLVNASVENGCLYVLPNQHHRGILQHYTGGHAGYLEITEDDLPPAEPTPVPMKAGSVLFMTNLTPHASFGNHTDEIRWSVDLRYQGADAPNNVDEDPADYIPERESVTMACYPPEADFVIKDADRPDREIRTAAQFHDLRERYETERPYSPGRGWTSLRK